jgi:hypothetical protein
LKHIELHVPVSKKGYIVDITHIPGTDNPADLFTKPLPMSMLEDFRQRMGVK